MFVLDVQNIIERSENMIAILHLDKDIIISACDDIEAVNFDKTDITFYDIYKCSKNDSYSGCNGIKFQ